MEHIRTMIEKIDEATRAQTERSRQMIEVVSRIRQIAEGTASRSAEFDQIVDNLSRQSASLESEVGAFKV
jgi:methyl-accepting chemotaxis protein